MYTKVLVPLDGSKTAEVALPHARALAYSKGAEIILLRVAVNPALEFSLSDPAIAQKIVKDSERESRQYIGSVATELQASGFEVSTVLAVGAAAEAILKTAEDIHADVIAMSTHGRTGPARWLLGSVADRVVRNSNVPVMLIRAQS